MADVTKILEEDHREAESLFAQIREEWRQQSADLVTELANALRLHMQVEETIVYPAIAKLIDGGAGIVGEAASEHQAARRALADVEKLSPDEPGFDDALETLEADISHHVEEEEDEVFPEFRASASSAELEELGDRVVAAKSAASSSSPTTIDVSHTDAAPPLRTE